MIIIWKVFLLTDFISVNNDWQNKLQLLEPGTAESSFFPSYITLLKFKRRERS